jgi:arsenite methyltransferase
MIELARRNAGRNSYTNVSFVQSDITSTPLADGTADCIISNCVINLVPQSRKRLVFKDMFRLLKTGGRIAVSDLLALKELPDAIRSNIAAYVGCIAGAAQVSQYEQWLREAGFTGESLLMEARRS